MVGRPGTPKRSLMLASDHKVRLWEDFDNHNIVSGDRIGQVAAFRSKRG
jgi:hypothetical protein